MRLRALRINAYCARLKRLLWNLKYTLQPCCHQAFRLHKQQYSKWIQSHHNGFIRFIAHLSTHIFLHRARKK